MIELRSTGNPDTSNPVTMSMLEYLRKKGIGVMGMTNGERIRGMSDEELAEIIKCPLKGKKCLWAESCKECCIRWLKEKCEE